MLQAWFNLLDMGLTPTIARETARFRGGAIDALAYRRLVRALELIFFVVAILGGTALFSVSGRIAADWLQASSLSHVEVKRAIQLMAAIIAMRWMCGLYRGTISGSERLVWLGAFNSAIATLRFVGVLPVLILIEASPAMFFRFQFLVAIVEITGLIAYSYYLMPTILKGEKLYTDWSPLKPVLSFSLTIAFTSSIWVVVTQTDKLILSKILPLADYGYFTLAVLVAGGVLIVSGPVSGAIMPRMSKLEAEGRQTELIEVYRRATQLVSIVAGSASITLACFAQPLLLAWTGDGAFSERASPILVLYALGNGVLAVSGFPYYLQYAKGDLKLHLIGNAMFVVVLVPLVAFAANRLGGVGAGYVWLGTNLLVFVAWLPLVHRKFAPGLNRRWYGLDVLMIVVPAALVGFGLSLILPVGDDRLIEVAKIAVAGVVVLLAAAAGSSDVRRALRMRVNR